MSKRPSGEIWEDGIRYVLMRPDVLMGVARELDGTSVAEFLCALEKSAFRHVQASFDRYQQERTVAGADFIASICEVAARLGWGRWSAIESSGRSVIVEVENSPFAAGFGTSATPVCATIAGVLRAAAHRAYGTQREVTELACAAQGAPLCRFEMPIVPR